MMTQIQWKISSGKFLLRTFSSFIKLGSDFMSVVNCPWVITLVKRGFLVKSSSIDSYQQLSQSKGRRKIVSSLKPFCSSNSWTRAALRKSTDASTIFWTWSTPISDSKLVSSKLGWCRERVLSWMRAALVVLLEGWVKLSLWSECASSQSFRDSAFMWEIKMPSLKFSTSLCCLLEKPQGGGKFDQGLEVLKISQAGSFLAALLHLDFAVPVLPHAIPDFPDQPSHYLLLACHFRLLLDFSPVLGELAEKIFGRYNIFFPPRPRQGDLNLPQVVVEIQLVHLVCLQHHQPSDYQLLVEVFRRPQHPDFRPVLQGLLVQVEDVSHEAVGHLPRVFSLQELRNVGVHASQHVLLHRRLFLPKLVFRDDQLLIHGLTGLLLQADIAHFPLQLFLQVNRLLELHEALSEHRFVAAGAENGGLIFLDFLAAEEVADFFGDDHERPEALLDFAAHALKEREGLLFDSLLAPEHLLPGLIGGEEKPHAHSSHGGRINFELALIGVSVGKQLLHAPHELVRIGLAEDGRAGLGKRVLLEGVEGRVEMEPDGQQLHEDVLTVEVGVKDVVGFLQPLFSEFVRNLFEEDAVAVELADLLSVFEKLELGEVVGVGGLGPVPVEPPVRQEGPPGVASAGLFVHLMTQFDIIYHFSFLSFQ